MRAGNADGVAFGLEYDMEELDGEADNWRYRAGQGVGSGLVSVDIFVFL